MLTKTLIGTNDDGSPHFHFSHSDPANAHILFTGKHISGFFKALDGTEYNVSESVIELASLRHAVEISNAIGEHFAEFGHPAHKPDDPFVHVPMAHPGDAFMALAGTLGENGALSGGLAAVMLYASLHTATTSTTGASEYAGVTRQAVAWNAPSGGGMTNSGGLAWTTSGLSAVSYVGTGNTLATGYSAANFALGFALGSSATAVSITAAPGALTASAS
jgi:hypothetical protein